MSSQVCVVVQVHKSGSGCPTFERSRMGPLTCFGLSWSKVLVAASGWMSNGHYQCQVNSVDVQQRGPGLGAGASGVYHFRRTRMGLPNFLVPAGSRFWWPTVQWVNDGKDAIQDVF